MFFLEMFKDHRKGQLCNWISVENRAVSTVDQAIKNGRRPCAAAGPSYTLYNACRSAVVSKVKRLRENMLLMFLDSECDAAIWIWMLVPSWDNMCDRQDPDVYSWTNCIQFLRARQGATCIFHHLSSFMFCLTTSSVDTGLVCHVPYNLRIYNLCL